ncbi:hypothetical protein FDN13_02195 [Caloramator sp. E03]|uniref:hypothetical protein n=1 Tax=Caloramator sp. E03 TaxID=2576307 RepID=UPI001110B8C2|nr:hypothetical protein [Caloramator sp. E03]QCX32601.1 hypothetical protein FDN13_02195 [Caloramator sp. E03]
MKRFFIYFSLSIITVLGMFGMIYAAKLPRTINEGGTKIYDLLSNPSKYDVKGAKGLEDVIVKGNLDKTQGINAVAAVFFDFRGYDRLSESFILLTAVSGLYVILKNGRRKKDDENEK